MRDETLIEKIKSLPPDQVAEVEDFVDFLSQREDRRLVESAKKLSENSFQHEWNNSDDADYDQL
ncbi:MAG: hypothetical protein QOJ64_4521 [Acidobacteriota bacterium]|nr:hypothetical protein [Acidobacteriota bacterium]